MALQPSRPGSGIGHGFLSSGPLKPFSYPRFRLFWAASLSSVMPFVMGMAARGWLVLVLTDSPFMVTAVQGVLMLPMALLTPFGGVIADRLNRKMVLLASDAANLLIFLGLTLLLLLGLIQVWHVFALAFLNGMAFAMSTPTRATVIHDVVGQGDLAKGVAVYTTVFSISQLVGPALAGYLMGRSPDQLGWTFLAASAFLVPAMAFLMPLSIPNRAAILEGVSRTSVMGSMGEGLGYVRANSLLVGLLLMSVVFAVFGVPYQTVLPVFARDILNAGPDGLGMLLAAAGAGAIKGSLNVALFSTARQMQVLIFATGFALGPTIILFAFSPYFPTSLVLVLGVGLMIQVFGVTTFALIQVGSPTNIRGRVVSILMLAWGLGPIGMFLLGFGAEVLAPEIALVVMGAISFALMGLLMLGIPALRRMELELGDRTRSPLEEALSDSPAVPTESD
ncbi:MAG: MFS transporter [Dehalococcoidia bacterium]|nr:MFS transporter [Dehalococcoidia bacterium]